MEKFNKHIQVESYNPKWPQMYEKEASQIKKALKTNLVEIHHFGSTSIPGLAAKPKIDILAVVKSISSIDIPSLENLGFEYRGELVRTDNNLSINKTPKNPSWIFLSKRKSTGNLKVNFHIFIENHPFIERNLLFRNWLRAHEIDRDNYARLKQKLALKHTDGIEYCIDKTEFINSIIEKAFKENNYM